MAVLLSVLAVSVTVFPARGSVPYLRSVGPVPLRFVATRAAGLPPGWMPLKYLLWPDLDPANARAATNAPAIKELAAATVAAITNVTSLAPVVLTAGPVEPTNTPSAPVIIMPVRTHPDADPVSSQVLSDYFRPAPGSGAGSRVRADEKNPGFTPPAPKSSPPSEATYGN